MVAVVQAAVEEEDVVVEERVRDVARCSVMNNNEVSCDTLFLAWEYLLEFVRTATSERTPVSP